MEQVLGPYYVWDRFGACLAGLFEVIILGLGQFFRVSFGLGLGLVLLGLGQFIRGNFELGLKQFVLNLGLVLLGQGQFFRGSFGLGLESYLCLAFENLT